MYVETPNVPGTPESRIAALKESRELLKGEPKVVTGGPFSGNSTEPQAPAHSFELINLATYIETGHDYSDLHPKGKRRPVIRHTNVTVLAPPALGGDEMEHFLHHVRNGDVAEFFEDLLKDAAENQPAEGDAGESAESGDAESK